MKLKTVSNRLKFDVIGESMGIECEYGFEDLFRAATGLEMTNEYKQRINTMTQEGRNAWVRAFVVRTNGEYSCDTEPGIGTDGIEYIAFWATRNVHEM